MISENSECEYQCMDLHKETIDTHMDTQTYICMCVCGMTYATCYRTETYKYSVGRRNIPYSGRLQLSRNYEGRELKLNELYYEEKFQERI